MDLSKSTRGRDPFADITNTTPQDVSVLQGHYQGTLATSMDLSKSTRGRDPFADITNTTPQGNQAPRGWRSDDVDPKARKRLKDRERYATMFDEKRMERNKKHHDCYMMNNVVDKENANLPLQSEGGRISMVKDENDDWLHRGDLDENDEWLHRRDLDGNDDWLHVSARTSRRLPTSYAVIASHSALPSPPTWRHGCLNPATAVASNLAPPSPPASPRLNNSI
uniref:Uncharacterized protein n=1 Tax=Setaria viridis TaxID=4556 RepID=A0A4U6VQT0_SETVI|nr:hypothetical protein SEVIR_2G086900v2 [Setaria viridis]